MGVVPSNLKDPTFLTPICNDCGICLCWDISVDEYEANKDFWDNWRCTQCQAGVSGKTFIYWKIGLLQGRPCKVITVSKGDAVLIQFEDGSRRIVSQDHLITP
jgi:hypothetical protein